MGDYADFAYESFTDRGISVDVSNAIFGNRTLDDFPHWLGTEERLEDGVRYIYGTEYDEVHQVIVFRKVDYASGVTVEEIALDSFTGKVSQDED